MNEHHRMDADMLVDDEFQSRETDTVIREHRRMVGELGIAEIDHDLGAGPRQGCRGDPCHLERQSALIDLANLAVGAADCDQRSGR